MALRIVTWLVSLGVHGAFALFMLMPAGGAALEQGAGDDVMVVEQGILLEGFAKLGDDVVTVEAVEAPPVQMAAAQPLPETVKPIEELPVEDVPQEIRPVEQQVVSSDAGPEQENVKEIDPEETEEPDPEQINEPELTEKKVEEIKPEVMEKPQPEEIEELKPEEVEQPLPQQVATVAQESVTARLESAAEEKKGGDTTAHHAYLGKLRTHLERSKVNPRTNLVGTAVVRLTVDAAGVLVSRTITRSSGSKVLDDAALASIERASPFPPIPEALHLDKFEVSVPFRFSVR